MDKLITQIDALIKYQDMSETWKSRVKDIF